jgi:hypothetical protein
VSAPAPARSRGRQPGQTSAAIAKAARKAGKSGGRPRDTVAEDVIASLGAPPKDAAGIRLWNARVVAEINFLVLKGQVGDELAGRVRAGATVLIKALPAIVRDEDEDEDLDDDEERGPELTHGGSDTPAHG